MLDPIETDEAMARDYIPLPGGWELQTKGTGSTLRLLDKKSGERYPLAEPNFVVAFIERMAREIHAACYSEELPPMPATGDRGPLDPTDPYGFLESDLDWLRDNPEALTWLIDNHRQIRKALMGVAGDARRHVICVCPDCVKPRSGWQLTTIDHAPGLDDLVQVTGSLEAHFLGIDPSLWTNPAADLLAQHLANETPEQQEHVEALQMGAIAKMLQPDWSRAVAEHEFEQAWAEFEAAGFLYGKDALEQVRFGFLIARGLRPGGKL